MARVKYTDLIAWGKSVDKRPADIARDLGLKSQNLVSWKKRNQVSADESDRVRAYMKANSKPAPIAALRSQLAATHGKVTGDLTESHVKLERAVAKMLGTLTDQQAEMLTRMIYSFAGENLIEEPEMQPEKREKK